ncbi:SDR family NAD(P)-dependent oxidoreductase [Fodinicola feengrottensis]|uniref:3-oxoacyl-[acyl-carrier-protein] reductase MabA n=1 Tax=Fodinicola feengrottensis TaxID=435914 RepID=A0ABN2JB61_9ACTN|nr:SDR family oxidoreductase [Fodinicola feengrottensis]
MDLGLAGKRAFVTASTGGIGAAIAGRLAAEGCAVLLHGRDAARAGKLARELGGGAQAILGDLSNPVSATDVCTYATAWRPDILVANAGPFVERDWESTTPADWASSFEGNLVSTVRVVQAVLPSMRQRGWGRVITIGSRAAVSPLENMVDYSAAKAALVNATGSLARHLSGTGITANTVSPGVILTPGLRRMFQERAGGDDWEKLAAAYAPNPAGRLGTGDDIAAAVAFLASPLAGYVNGTNLRVDGGLR